MAWWRRGKSHEVPTRKGCLVTAETGAREGTPSCLGLKSVGGGLSREQRDIRIVLDRFGLGGHVVQCFTAGSIQRCLSA